MELSPLFKMDEYVKSQLKLLETQRDSVDLQVRRAKEQITVLEAQLNGLEGAIQILDQLQKKSENDA